MLLKTTIAGQSPLRVSDTIVPPVKSEWNPEPTKSQKDFIRRHPAVERIAWGYMADVKIAGTGNGQATPARSGLNEGDMFMIIYFKNGKWDMYNVNNEESVSKFKKNYGELPPRAPAPPRSSTVYTGKKK